MSDTVKLIIEIPKEAKQAFDEAKSYHNLKCGFYDCGIIGKAIQNGIPLDDVKAEIAYNAEIHEDGECYLMEQWVYDALDGKYRAESEE